jgi:hypothetical protein
MPNFLDAQLLMQQADQARDELKRQQQLTNARLRFLEAEQDNVRTQAKTFLQGAQGLLQDRLRLGGRGQQLAGGPDPGIFVQPPGGVGLDPGIAVAPPGGFAGDPGILQQPGPGGTLGASGRAQLVRVLQQRGVDPQRVGLTPETLPSQGDATGTAPVPLPSTGGAAGAVPTPLPGGFQAPAVPGTAVPLPLDVGGGSTGSALLDIPARDPRIQQQAAAQQAEAQQAADAAGQVLDPRDLKKLGSFFFWEREGAKGRINAKLGYNKFQVEKADAQARIERNRAEAAALVAQMQRDLEEAMQLDEELRRSPTPPAGTTGGTPPEASPPPAGDVHAPAAAGPPAPGAAAPAAPDARLGALETARGELEERRRRLLPFTRTEQGKRAYDAVGSQLDDVTQQMARIQDESQEERRFQQSERRLSLAEQRQASAEERRADAEALRARTEARVAQQGERQTEISLQKEFNDLTKDYRQVRDAWGKIVASAQTPSAAGDLSLIFGYMKLLDPTSVVREGEFATAQNAGGIPDRIRAAYNRALSGERMSEPMRADFVDRGKKLYTQYTTDYQGVRRQYRGIAERYDLNPDNVTLDYESGAAPPPPPPAPVLDPQRLTPEDLRRLTPEQLQQLQQQIQQPGRR